MAFVNNPAQEKAIKTIKGPVIIVSCPGSGKTTTLVRRIKNIIDSGANPKKILMVTFANDAAKEMAAKYKEMYKENPGVNFSTIHALCLNILMIERGYKKESIISEHEVMEFFIEQMKYLSDINDAWETARQVVSEISLIKNNYINISSYKPESLEKKTFIELFKAYENYKRKSKLIDFDDMIIHALHLLEDDERVRKRWQNRFDFIQVDEYQDTNQIQRDIIYILADKHKNLCVVGDDDQSIYRFRGADFSIMLNFENDFDKVQKINMSTNYRSTKKIVEMADTCIQRNTKRFDKNFVSFRGEEKKELGETLYAMQTAKPIEIDKMVKLIKERHDKGIEYKDMAILFRTNKQATPIVEALENKDIPYNAADKVKSLFDSWIFEDIKSYIELSFGENTNYNLRKVINHPNRFLKADQFMNIDYSMQGLKYGLNYMKRQGASDWQYNQALESLTTMYKYFGKGVLNKVSPTKKVIEGLNKINYKKYLEDSAKFRNDDVQDYIDEYNNILGSAKRFKTIGDWLKYTKMSIMAARARSKKKDKNGIAIMTMHGSKGLEWNSVFLTGISEGIVPNKKAETSEDIEEERRIFYVAMTRAKDYLYITGTGTESRFMEEIKIDLKERLNPNIPKKMAGSKVFHKEHGEGKIVNYTQDKVRVRYKGGGILEYPFPEIFQERKMKYI